MNQPVPLQQPVALQQVTQQSQGFNPIGEMKIEKSKLSQAMDSLHKVVPEAMTEATTQLNIKAEEDKTRQTNRALNDLEPTDDATKTGRTAHRMVDVRNRTNEVILRLNVEASTFKGSAEDWEDHVATVQEELFFETGTDKDTLEVTGAIFREQLPASHLIKFKADQERDQFRKAESSKQSLKQAVTLSTNPDELIANVVASFEEGKATGIAPLVQEEALVNGAIELAVASNDLRLIEVAKAMGIYEQHPKLQEAEKKAKLRIKNDEQEFIFLQKEQLESKLYTQIKAKGLTRTEGALLIAEMASKQVTTAGDKIWTQPQLSALLDKLYTQKGEEDLSDIEFEVTLATDVLGGETFVNSTGWSAEKKRTMVDKYNEMHYEKVKGLELQGLDPAQMQLARRSLMKNKATWLSQVGITDYTWKQKFEDFEKLPISYLENAEGTEFEQSTNRTLQLFEDLADNPDMLATHASAEAIALYDNYKKNVAQGTKPIPALLEAKRQMAHKDRPLSIEDKKDFRASVESEIDSTFSNWIPTIVSGIEDVTEATVQKIADDIHQRALTFFNMTGDKSSAISRAISEYGSTHTMLSNGTSVKGDMTFLASQMGFSADANRVNDVLVTLPERLLEMSLISGNESMFPNTTTPTSEWQMEVTDDGFVLLSDIYGAPIGRPMTLSEVAGFNIDYTVERRRRADYAKKYYAEQKHRQELQSYGRLAPDAKYTKGKSPIALEREEEAKIKKLTEENNKKKEEQKKADAKDKTERYKTLRRALYKLNKGG